VVKLLAPVQLAERRLPLWWMYLWPYPVYGSREKFERQEYEKGLFDVDERNKEIDEAISMLKQTQ
jgi:hypothetical protein